ncbi:MAG TPA: hypothetical protein VLA45_06185 [Paracoccaceae bacterium]|nr:hypothetical protein [Paracoccaceae bacterium]
MSSDRLMRPALLLAAPLLLAGCAATHSASVGEIDPADFGEANRQTYAAMIINPDPQYSEPMSTSAEHAADAAERYRTDSVKQPERVSSTEGVSN